MPASIGKPPPPPPSRSKQQWVAGLQVASQGACASISLILESIFWMSPAQLHAGAPPPPELLELELLELLLDVEPELPELPELLEELDVLVPDSVGPGFDGGGSVELEPSWVSSPAPPPPPPGGISEADSAHAETTRTEATMPVATRA